MPANAINPEPLKQAMKEMGGVSAPLGEIRDSHDGELPKEERLATRRATEQWSIE